MTEHELPIARESPPAGCGVQGCLVAAVALFVILLLALLFISIIRFSSPPQPRYGAAAPTAATLAAGASAQPSTTRDV